MINKHAPLKRLSKRKSKQFKKPWITKGIKIAIRKKNEHFIANKHDKYIYILYRNSIRSLTRASKKLFYQSFFNQNLSNMKKTWEGIRELIGRQKKYCKSISAVGANSSSPLVNDTSKIANNMNFHFATCGHHLAAK